MLYSPPAEDWRLLALGIVDPQRVGIEEAGLAGVTLLRHHHPYAHQLRLVGQHLDEARMRHADNVLVIPPPQIHLLFPQRILADAQRPDALRDEQINDAT